MFYNNNHSKLPQNILRIFLIFQLDTTSMVLNFFYLFFFLFDNHNSVWNKFTIGILISNKMKKSNFEILFRYHGKIWKKYVFFYFYFFFQLKTDKFCSYIIPWKALTVDITHKRFSNRLSNVILSSLPSITMATGSQTTNK